MFRFSFFKLMIVSFCISNASFAQSKNILFFLAQENTYYSEYIVAAEALKAAGYTVDVRSATSGVVTTYMLPVNTTINETANSLSGSSYSDFQNQFNASFGQNWNGNLNVIPQNIAVNGRIQDVSNMNNYDALIIAGGTGIVEYRVDGSYSSNGTADAIAVQSAAEKLNELAIDALQKGKPVLAQCHGASLPVFWRVPNTAGTGSEALGISLLKNGNATGYPEPQTAITLADFGVTFQNEDRLTVSSPNSLLTNANNGSFKLLTSRDWYPQTVAYATRALLNILETYPSFATYSYTKKVLVLHGGAVDVNNCLYTNRNNDVPCNYGGGVNLPADYTDIETLLSSTSTNDQFNFSASFLNLAGTLHFDINNEAEILSYFQGFQTVVFYKHWSTFLSDALQNALVSFADLGGGVVGLHHALYNDIDGNQNKNIICNQLFGAESSQSAWSANRTTYNFFNSNYGHFVSTYGVLYANAAVAPSSWVSNAPLSSSNLSHSTYPQFSLFDEIYNNMSFTAGQSFGRQVNAINPLFSNNLTPSSQAHTSGFVKLFNPTMDGTVGRVVYLQAGENVDNYSLSFTYAQVIRNAVAWAAGGQGLVTSATTLNSKAFTIYPNPARNELNFAEPISNFSIVNILGQEVYFSTSETKSISVAHLKNGVYFLKHEGKAVKFIIQ